MAPVGNGFARVPSSAAKGSGSTTDGTLGICSTSALALGLIPLSTGLERVLRKSAEPMEAETSRMGAEVRTGTILNGTMLMTKSQGRMWCSTAGIVFNISNQM